MSAFRTPYVVSSANNYEDFATFEEAEEFARNEALESKEDAKILYRLAEIEYKIVTPLKKNKRKP